MKHVISIVLGILFFFNSSFANQQISDTEKLALTAKIWGFLKYYHPNVATGKFNWDQELFQILPKIKASATKDDLSQTFLEWIENLGEVKECKKCRKVSKGEVFDKNFNLNWIKNNSLMTNKLSEKLIFIEQNRHQGKKYYVSLEKYIGNIKIDNEIIYNDADWKSENFRLLTLFRYWNIIEYFFPYKYQTDTNWDEVLNQMIPSFLESKTEQDFHLAMHELIVRIDDSHGTFYTDLIGRFFGKYFIPASFYIFDDKVFITGLLNETLATKDDLKIGDIITKVDNQTIAEILTSKRKYISGSNVQMKLYNSDHAIFNGSTDSVTIEFQRNNQIQTKKIARYLYLDLKIAKKKTTESFKIFQDNIGYINMGSLTIEEVPSAMKALKETKAIIFDIRNQPNGTLYSISNYLNSDKRDFYKKIYPDLNYPGKFIWSDGAACGKKGELKYKGQVVLLVNQETQSHAEFTTMCLQKGDNVTTIGTQTSGADGSVSRFQMATGALTLITGIGIFYPDKTETQRKGVKIDIVVNPTLDGLKKQKDEILEKALEFLRN